jgi:hypothetical protein
VRRDKYGAADADAWPMGHTPPSVLLRCEAAIARRTTALDAPTPSDSGSEGEADVERLALQGDNVRSGGLLQPWSWKLPHSIPDPPPTVEAQVVGDAAAEEPTTHAVSLGMRGAAEKNLATARCGASLRTVSLGGSRTAM